MLKGTIIENSLNDLGILKKCRIEKTYEAGSWILHNVFIEEALIPELQHSLAEGPWYIHVWEPGKDDVIVVFKDAQFRIKFSDTSTWDDAIAHGIAMGIPKEQLDFPID